MLSCRFPGCSPRTVAYNVPGKSCIRVPARTMNPIVKSPVECPVTQQTQHSKSLTRTRIHASSLKPHSLWAIRTITKQSRLFRGFERRDIRSTSRLFDHWQMLDWTGLRANPIERTAKSRWTPPLATKPWAGEVLSVMSDQRKLHSIHGHTRVVLWPQCGLLA